MSLCLIVSVGSDYYSQASPGSRSSVASETGSEDTCHGNVTARGAPGTHSPLSATKSFTYPDIETTASCSYFRSPKLNAKVSVSTQFLKVRHPRNAVLDISSCD